MKKREIEPVLLIPQSISAASLALGEVPGDAFVVSRYANGDIASVYGDTTWTWTPYVESGRSSILNFEYWANRHESTERRTSIVAEMHWILFLLIWKRSGPTYAFSTLNGYMTLLRALARHCEEKRCSIREVLTNRKRLLDFAASRTTGSTVGLFGSLLQTLADLGAEIVGYSVLNERAHKILRGAVDKYFASLHQHPPLPTRIYSHVITVLLKELDEFQAVSERYLALVEACVKDPFLGRCSGRRYAKQKKFGEPVSKDTRSMSVLLAEFRLTAYFESKKIYGGIKGLSTGLSRIITVIRLIIHAFSGMRDEEVGQLKYDCLREELRAGKMHYIIDGTTSKHNHGKPKHVSWVTSIDGKRAIDVAQAVTALNHKLWRGRDANSKKPKISYEPLFASIACFGLGGNAPKGSEARLIPALLDLSSIPSLREALEPVIESADLAELKQIDPHRAWHTEKNFQVGRRWTLTSHQLRRSLALYAQRSGLVSLPSLRRQLQHITEEMSRYYARGSVFARNFIGKNKQHFGNEWQDTQPVSAFLGYLKQVLLSDDVLFGAHGNWIEHRLRDSEGIILVDREVTMRRFKNGEMAYRETLLGGCTTIDVCDRLPINWLNVHCVDNCEKFVGHLSKLEQVIAVQTNLVASLDVLTPEYRSEKADLEILIKTRDKVYARIGRKEAS